MTKYEQVQQGLLLDKKTWLVSGVAGFIGSNLLEKLLKLNQTVVGLDNFSTGHQYNLDAVKSIVTTEQWNRFKFVEGDICDQSICAEVMLGVDYVLHQAALGSVPRSINDPLSTNLSNITGFLNMLTAAKNENVESFTYAASSSTYGDHPALPKIEENIGNPLSPYAVTKYVNELYAEVYARTYGFNCIGLRYFNVFGKRQDPNGAYAAVIPKWISALKEGNDIGINGDGLTSRDFCYVENTVQMNILAATAPESAKNEIYNVALGDRTSLNDLYQIIREILKSSGCKKESKVNYNNFRLGDVKHSQADISKAVDKLGYVPTHKVSEGLDKTVKWFLANSN